MLRLTSVILPQLTSLDSFQSWYTHNLQISIPVTIVVGIVVLLILWGITRCKSLAQPNLKNAHAERLVTQVSCGHVAQSHKNPRGFQATPAPRR